MIILKDDYDLVKERIRQIKLELRELAAEFHEVLNQSSETWHDNAPWDAAKTQEAVLLAELESLDNIRRTYKIHDISEESPIGHFHKLKFNNRDVSVFLAGDFSIRNGQELEGHTIVTTGSPIAQDLLGKL